ncbi:MAG: oligopeptide/dipeptide ABC transporter ATP-binding protein [Rhabdochlamydiaceae bacterium]|jgi:oligopeptide/dipeptide ABC transporter ATP-binding protein
MTPLIEVKNLRKEFHVQGKKLVAIRDISLTIFKGETLGLVGESGCGKSTTGRLLLQLERATSGEVVYEQKNLLSLNRKELFLFRRHAQIIFQDPYSSLNPRMTAGDIIAEPLRIHRSMAEGEIKNYLSTLIDKVGLSQSALSRFPHEFSGGQRQRIGIARALALKPHFIVCDEPISALDVSVQAQIVNLLKDLQKELNLTYLFIAHDLAMVKYISDRVAVMYLGSIVEIAPASELYSNPQHPYTQALLSAIPIPDPLLERKRKPTLLTGEPSSPLALPKGCAFASRCPHAMAKCHQVQPQATELIPGHLVACHLHTEEVAKKNINAKTPSR